MLCFLNPQFWLSCLIGTIDNMLLLCFLLLFLLEIGSNYVIQAGLKFRKLLPQPGSCWYCRHAPAWLTAMWFYLTANSYILVLFVVNPHILAHWDTSPRISLGVPAFDLFTVMDFPVSPLHTEASFNTSRRKSNLPFLIFSALFVLILRQGLSTEPWLS